MNVFAECEFVQKMEIRMKNQAEQVIQGKQEMQEVQVAKKKEIMQETVEQEPNGQELSGIPGQIEEAFDCGVKDIRTYSPLPLAYIGDAVYDLIIRTVLVERSNRAANELHKKASTYVKAGTQAQMAVALEEYLTEEEAEVYRRGRNAKSYTTAKNATIADYRKATGLEALVGYLYLTHRMDRVLELVRLGLERIGREL